MSHKRLKLVILILLGLRLTGCQVEKVKDIEGNVYKTVKIGTQIWMAENLKTTKYNDGTTIPLLTDNTEWCHSADAYCWYHIDAVGFDVYFKKTYGALYNWYTVHTGKLCPKGWHVPTSGEWRTLIKYQGGVNVAGGKLKEAGTAHWNLPNTGATNETGFTALPGGYRESSYGIFEHIGDYGYWWSASQERYIGDPWCWEMSYQFRSMDRPSYSKRYGFSVRCVKD